MEERDDIFSIARAFMKSRIILTAAELDLFSQIQRGYETSEKIAAKLNLNQRALSRVLDCLVTFGLLDKKGADYSLTDSGAPFSADNPASSLPMILHMSRLWESWSALTEIVERGTGAEKPPKPMDPESRRAFIGAMHVIGKKLSEDVAQSLNLSGFKKLLDIGGGSGTYTIAFLKWNPQLKAVLFDLKDVIPMAEERLSSAGFLDRTELLPGDFYQDELPKGCDVALLSAIIHQNSPGQNLELYSKAFRALEPGGMLIIRDHVMNNSRTWPPEGAMFAINMLVNTWGGDTYTFEEVEKALKEAGFSNVELVRTGERMDCIVTARKI